MREKEANCGEGTDSQSIVRKATSANILCRRWRNRVREICVCVVRTEMLVDGCRANKEMDLVDWTGKVEGRCKRKGRRQEEHRRAIIEGWMTSSRMM